MQSRGKGRGSLREEDEIGKEFKHPKIGLAFFTPCSGG
jgi:hypothetical protein